MNGRLSTLEDPRALAEDDGEKSEFDDQDEYVPRRGIWELDPVTKMFRAGTDEVASARVFSLYEKDARENGFRSEEIIQKAANAEELLAGAERSERGLTMLQERALAAIAALTEQAGKKPSIMEVADAIAIAGKSDASRRVAMTGTLLGIRGSLVEWNRGGIRLLSEGAPEAAPPAARPKGTKERMPTLSRWSVTPTDAPEMSTAEEPKPTNTTNMNEEKSDMAFTQLQETLLGAIRRHIKEKGRGPTTAKLAEVYGIGGSTSAKNQSIRDAMAPLKGTTCEWSPGPGGIRMLDGSAATYDQARASAVGPTSEPTKRARNAIQKVAPPVPVVEALPAPPADVAAPAVVSASPRATSAMADLLSAPRTVVLPLLHAWRAASAADVEKFDRAIAFFEAG